MSSETGFFISLEGCEGVGKTTSLNFIKSYIEQRGQKVVVTREPGGTPLAEDIRQSLLAQRDEVVEIETELLLMFAARFQHVEQVIKPALNSGAWVLCDRFIDATYAYQGGGRGLPKRRIAEIDQWTLNGFLPDLTILLDMPVEQGMARTRLRGEADRFESEDITFYQKIRRCYLQRAADYPQRIKLVDAAPEIATVQNALLKVLRRHCPPTNDPGN